MMSTMLDSSPVSLPLACTLSNRLASSATVRSVSFDLRLRSHTAEVKPSELTAGQPGKKYNKMGFPLLSTLARGIYSGSSM
jgi:hypothetical protein